MSDTVDPLSEFTIALPTKAQSELVLRATHEAFGRGQTFEEFVEKDKAGQAESWYKDGAERTWYVILLDGSMKRY